MEHLISTKDLISQLEKLSQRLFEIVSRDFSSLNSNQYNWKEYIDKWSIAECFAHLNKVYDAYLPELEQLILNAQATQLKPNPTFKATWFGNRFLNQIQLGANNLPKKNSISPIKYAPDVALSQHNGQQIIAFFLKKHQHFLDLIQKTQFINIQSPKMAAALKGLIKISLGDLIKILVYHTERHVVQAQRVLYHDDFPSNSSIDFLEVSSN